MSADDPAAGWTAPDVRTEFPELRLWSMPVKARPGRTSRGVKERLRHLSSRFGGAQAIQLRTDPIPHAYRVFYRHVGMDPDAERVPVEQAVVDRLMHGGFKAHNLIDDALVLALIETGVPIWALDAARVEGDLGIRLAGAREDLGEGIEAKPLREGRMIVADEVKPIAELFGDVGSGFGVSPGTAALLLFSVQVAGVPAIHLEEALWTAAEALDTA